MYVWYTRNTWCYGHHFSRFIGCGFVGGITSESYWLVPGTED